MSRMKVAIVNKEGYVTNIAIITDENEWHPGPDCVLVPFTDEYFETGWKFVNGQFMNPEEDNNA